jgi:probable rRNA maturation factor
MEKYLVGVQVDGDWPVDAEAVRQTGIAVLIHQDVTAAEVALVISSDETLRELNRRFRNVDSATDVLAFADDTRGPYAVGGDQVPYLGDVVISFPRAEEQSAQAGHSVLAELQLLVVHGMLHLLGFDDQEQSKRSEMWAVQAAVIAALGIEVNLPD